MKYTYFSSIKSGKYLIRSQFWYNRRSCCFLSQSTPLWCVMSRPIGKLDKLEWWWVNKQYELESHSHFLDTSDKLASSHYDEMWFPKNNHEGHEYIPREQWITHNNFWGCYDNILSRDLITNPFNLLGYAGGLGSQKMMLEMKNKTPNIQPQPDIVQQLKKRKNIVVYKEDIEHLAYNVFAGNGRPESVDDTINILNNIIRFQKLMPKVLDSYGIPYEMFSLDTGSYSKTFDLDKELPRNSSDTIFTRNIWNQNVKQQVSDYMKNYG